MQLENRDAFIFESNLLTMENILKPADLYHLENDFGVNVMKELIILNRTAYGNMLDVVRLTREINLVRIKRFSSPKSSRSGDNYSH